jgi:hypothetical protein
MEALLETAYAKWAKNDGAQTGNGAFTAAGRQGEAPGAGTTRLTGLANNE